VERHHRNEALQDDLAQAVRQGQMGTVLERETRYSWQLRYRHRLGQINTLPTLLNVTNRLRFNGAGKDHKGNFHYDIKIFVFFVAYLSRRETDQDWFSATAPQGLTHNITCSGHS